MEGALVRAPASAPDFATSESSGVPFAQEMVVVSKQDYIHLKWAAHYWKAQYERVAQREGALKQEVEAQKAQIRDLTHRLYGKKSEKGAEKKPGQAPSARQRGQQPASAGHGRTARPQLPVVIEVREVPADQRHCAVCGTPYGEFPSTEDSQIVEVHIQAHIRRIKRQRYCKGCQCPGVCGIITTPPAPRLLPKTSLGVSVWTAVLLDKYLYSRPTHRLCEELGHQGFPLAQGTLTDGLQRLAPVFVPVMEALREKQMSEAIFHNDETRWAVFEEVPGKHGHRWYLWVTRSGSVVFYQMAASRSAAVPKDHFADLQALEVVVVCDRYTAYKCLAKHQQRIILAFCWAHVRRDFLDAARSWPEWAAWMWEWIDDIRELYHLNAARLEVWNAARSLPHQPLEFRDRQSELVNKLTQMKACWEEQLQEKVLPSTKRKVLTSLKNHWAGLLVFVDHPDVAMDNNAAERALRNPVTGRKNYYGSGSVWSAKLAAVMFSVLQTVLLWGLNPRHWLQAFLQACADHGGTPPPDLSEFLPWTMNAQRKHQLSQPLPVPFPHLESERPDPSKPRVIDTS
jgi:transposase